jgi:ATP-binding cassette subfamily B protein
LANLYGTVQSALAGAERVFATMDEVPEAPDAPDAVALTEVHGEVAFDNVSFSYTEDVPVLKEVSFHAVPGQTIALVGETGSG